MFPNWKPYIIIRKPCQVSFETGASKKRKIAISISSSGSVLHPVGIPPKISELILSQFYHSRL